ncbi:hypothetical protein Y09_0544 [Brachybacterium sp. SW0106-09]|nr:hypothetical protein Y09_0544 [Brachybacterium sp. SW0106-09]
MRAARRRTHRTPPRWMKCPIRGHTGVRRPGRARPSGPALEQLPAVRVERHGRIGLRSRR